MVHWFSPWLLCGYNAGFRANGGSGENKGNFVAQMNKVWGLFAAAGLGLCLSVVAMADRQQDIADRIKPAGKSCLVGEECAAAPVAVASSDGPRSGEQVYTTKCFSCHATGAAGAPKLGDAAAWAPRIAQGAETLYTHAIGGLNGMPAKGLCMDCSDDEIKAAVDHMVAGSQ
ncbi:cellulose binding, type IV [Simiduia agarivorans SA1 = DSM 21679]|uniref:Cellulose binding, type IV n=2 Tax=Simiduia TaxID=447467 RepID=K4KK66_SIMAS|nr:cellulose binding, type IV [Simiduia agarivorans SA1 = DSM 21679]